MCCSALLQRTLCSTYLLAAYASAAATAGQLQRSRCRFAAALRHVHTLQLLPHRAQHAPAQHTDPLRVLRAVRFATRFGFELHADILEAAASERVRTALGHKISRERIGTELEGMFNGARVCCV